MDERRRRLERDALLGDLEAQARHMRERVRAGDLASERLELAAWIGDDAARLAATPSAETYALLAYGHAESCGTLEDPPQADLRERILRAIDAREGSPDYVTRSLAREARARALAELGVTFLWPGEPPVSTCPLCERSLPLDEWVSLIAVWGRGVQRRAVDVARALLREGQLPYHMQQLTSPDDPRWILYAARILSEAEVRSAIREALLPWVLGVDS